VVSPGVCSKKLDWRGIWDSTKKQRTYLSQLVSELARRTKKSRRKL
jgi:hypothetical protein